MTYDIAEKIDTILGELEQLKKKQAEMQRDLTHICTILDAAAKASKKDD